MDFLRGCPAQNYSGVRDVNLKYLIAVMAAFSLGNCLSANATGDQAGPQAAGHPLTAADAESWLDGLVPTALKTGHVPGAVVVIVKDGQVLLEKGYGFADYEKRIPVDP